MNRPAVVYIGEFDLRNENSQAHLVKNNGKILRQLGYEVFFVGTNRNCDSFDAVDKLRKQGIKAGLVKPRVYRPFPGEEIANALRKARAVAILDKADGLNAVGGPLFTDTTSAMFVNNATAPIALSYIYGIGGRDVREEDIESVYKDLQDVAMSGNSDNPYRYLGLKGGRD